MSAATSDAIGASAPALLGGDSPAAWLSDGRIVFGHYRDDAPLPRWYVMRPDGSGLHSLPQQRGVADPFDWLEN